MDKISFEIAAFILSSFCLIYSIAAKKKQYIPPKGLMNKITDQHFTFLLMLISNIASAISSVTGTILLNYEGAGISVWQYLFHALYFVFHQTLSISFALYIMNVTTFSKNRKKIFYLLIGIPYILSEIIVFTNSLTGWAFYMDPAYHRGPLMLVLYGIGGFYVTLGFITFFRHKKAISKIDSTAVGLFILLATLGIIIQAIKSSIIVELYSESIACLVLMVVLEEKSSYIDQVTNALNKIAFEDTNRRLIETKQNYNVISIQIRDFDKFAAKFNSRTIDYLLFKIANYLSSIISYNSLYTIRRDRFVIVDSQISESDAMDIVNKIIERFKKEWEINELSLKLDVLCLLIKVPENVTTLDELELILLAEYQYSKLGSMLIPLYNVVDIKKESLYEQAIKQAVQEHKLFVNYQPIYSLKAKKTVSLEALLRVDLDELRNVSPEIYIPIAEKTGLIKEIGLFVFEEVCKFLSNDYIKNSSIEYIELNLSTYQFMYSDLVESFENIRKKYNIEANKINLEITETAASIDSDDLLAVLEKFRNIGYSLSLDDFGTGYSNFIRMINSHFLNIKIDKSILWDAEQGRNPELVLGNIMDLIKKFGYSIIQEGVETKEQLDLVSCCGCDLIQGYYFSKPICDKDLIAYLEKEDK